MTVKLSPKEQRLYNYLKKKKSHSITSLEAIDKLGDTRLSATIFLLRKKFFIIDEYVSSTNRYGEKTKFKVYTLAL